METDEDRLRELGRRRCEEEFVKWDDKACGRVSSQAALFRVLQALGLPHKGPELDDMLDKSGARCNSGFEYHRIIDWLDREHQLHLYGDNWAGRLVMVGDRRAVVRWDGRPAKNLVAVRFCDTGEISESFNPKLASLKPTVDFAVGSLVEAAGLRGVDGDLNGRRGRVDKCDEGVVFVNFRSNGKSDGFRSVDCDNLWLIESKPELPPVGAHVEILCSDADEYGRVCYGQRGVVAKNDNPGEEPLLITLSHWQKRFRERDVLVIPIDEPEPLGPDDYACYYCGTRTWDKQPGYCSVLCLEHVQSATPICIASQLHDLEYDGEEPSQLDYAKAHFNGSWANRGRPWATIKDDLLTLFEEAGGGTCRLEHTFPGIQASFGDKVLTAWTDGERLLWSDGQLWVRQTSWWSTGTTGDLRYVYPEGVQPELPPPQQPPPGETTTTVFEPLPGVPNGILCGLGNERLWVVSDKEARSFVGEYVGTRGYAYQSGERLIHRDSKTHCWGISFRAPPELGQRLPQLLAKEPTEHPWQVAEWKICESPSHFWYCHRRKIFCLQVRDERWAILPTGSVRVHLVEPGFPDCEIPLCRICGAPIDPQDVEDGLCRCRSHLRSLSVLPETRRCPVYQQALMFVEHMGLRAFRDATLDVCWCAQCYPADRPDKAWMSRLVEYIIPRGWVSLGVEHPPRRPRAPEFYDVTFHGLPADVVAQVMLHHRVGTAGDRMPKGFCLYGANTGGRNSANFYTAPCAAYAGLQHYAAVFTFGPQEQFGGQVVLQLRQNPHTLKATQMETMGYQAKEWDDIVSPHMSVFQKGVEFVSMNNSDCDIERMLIRTFDIDRPPDKENLGGKYEHFRSPRDRPTGKERHPGSLWL